MAPTQRSIAPGSPALDAERRALLRARSKLVLGNKDRLEVCAAIAESEDGLVNATDLQAEIGIAQSRIRNQLVALAEGDLLIAHPRDAGKQWYQRRDSAFWPACIALYEDWIR